MIVTAPSGPPMGGWHRLRLIFWNKCIQPILLHLFNVAKTTTTLPTLSAHSHRGFKDTRAPLALPGYVSRAELETVQTRYEMATHQLALYEDRLTQQAKELDAVVIELAHVWTAFTFSLATIFLLFLYLTVPRATPKARPSVRYRRSSSSLREVAGKSDQMHNVSEPVAVSLHLEGDIIRSSSQANFEWRDGSGSSTIATEQDNEQPLSQEPPNEDNSQSLFPSADPHADAIPIDAVDMKEPSFLDNHIQSPKASPLDASPEVKEMEDFSTNATSITSEVCSQAIGQPPDSTQETRGSTKNIASTLHDFSLQNSVSGSNGSTCSPPSGSREAMDGESSDPEDSDSDEFDYVRIRSKCPNLEPEVDEPPGGFQELEQQHTLIPLPTSPPAADACPPQPTRCIDPKSTRTCENEDCDVCAIYDPDLDFSHRPTSKSAPTCALGPECTDKYCTYRHPDFRINWCLGGDRCGNRSTCGKSHPAGSECCSTIEFCNEGSCWWYHPPDWKPPADYRNGIPCRFGKRCRNGNNCRFYHER